MLLNVLLQIKVAESSPMHILVSQLPKPTKQLLGFVVNGLDMLRVHFRHETEHFSFCSLATNTHEFERSRDERRDLAEVFLLKVFKSRPELNCLVAIYESSLDFGQRLVE